ncbi:MAG: transcriptional regulator, LuxR family, partial [Frankiales bacterium]|nr:transcriptional regulator, LuxR family [Frankiales bacterium]
ADRLARLVAAGGAAWQAGLPEHAVALLAEVTAAGPPARVRARVAELSGAVAARTGSMEQARDLLVAAGEEVATDDPDAAVMLFADAVLACFLLGDVGAVRAAGRRIEQLAGRTTTARARLVGPVASGVAAVLVGVGGPPVIREALRAVAVDDPLVDDPRVAPWLVAGPLFLRERAPGPDLVQAVIDSVRRRSVVGGLPQLLFLLARDQATTDRWDDAEVTYTEGISLAREAGQTADLAACLAGLGWLEARRGQELRSREHLEEAVQLCVPRHIALLRCWSLYALGELELGLGRPEAALVQLDQLEALLSSLGLVDVDLSPAPERAHALLRLGRQDEAREAAAGYEERAVTKAQPWALARAHRAVMLTCGDDEVDGHAARALACHTRTADAFELARTQLAYGTRLRRARRRIDARPPLRAALSTLELLGASPWADQAARELVATGETAARRGASLLSALTPQELQVAQMLAAGRTTREAASALFLSAKTVEYHLRHVYGKLAVSSRTELTSALGTGP